MYDALKLAQALTLVLSDMVTEPVDALFLHTRSFGDEDGLYRCRMVKSVLLNGSDGEGYFNDQPGIAWPGKLEYTRRMKELGIDNILYTDPALHTRAESDAFLKIARQHNWRSAIVVTQPSHVLRAFLSQVKSMKDNQYWMRIYTMCPRPLDWNKPVHGSQGLESKPRFEQIADELSRLPEYEKKGYIAGLDEAIEYFLRREVIV